MFYSRTAGEETAAAWFKDPPGGQQDEGEATKYQSAFRLGLSTLFFWFGVDRMKEGRGRSTGNNIYSEHSAWAPSISGIRAHM